MLVTFRLTIGASDNPIATTCLLPETIKIIYLELGSRFANKASFLKTIERVCHARTAQS
jgi:hypothetical protein